jgi:hypothetical protein
MQFRTNLISQSLTSGKCDIFRTELLEEVQIDFEPGHDPLKLVDHRLTNRDPPAGPGLLGVSVPSE